MRRVHGAAKAHVAAEFANATWCLERRARRRDWAGPRGSGHRASGGAGAQARGARAPVLQPSHPKQGRGDPLQPLAQDQPEGPRKEVPEQPLGQGQAPHRPQLGFIQSKKAPSQLAVLAAAERMTRVGRTLFCRGDIIRGSWLGNTSSSKLGLRGSDSLSETRKTPVVCPKPRRLSFGRPPEVTSGNDLGNLVDFRFSPIPSSAGVPCLPTVHHHLFFNRITFYGKIL
jgi:hypothetical protein